MLHGALLKLLQIFFGNFHSDFQCQEACNQQTHDVETNTEICQFNIAAFYSLQPNWLTRYSVQYIYKFHSIHTHVYIHKSVISGHKG